MYAHGFNCGFLVAGADRIGNALVLLDHLGELVLRREGHAPYPVQLPLGAVEQTPQVGVAGAFADDPVKLLV
ncbi:hypothetical protein D3C80_1920840 [compost metagenome]